jgi:hypothetical protein
MILIALLTGCSFTRTPIPPPVKPDFTVQINRSFESLPNYTRLYFQEGKQAIYAELDQWKTYCRLHVFNPDRKADYLTSVIPGSFNISKVALQLETSESAPGRPVYFGSIGMGLMTASSSSSFDREIRDLPSYYLYRVNLKLSSTSQPDVQSLICARKWGSYGNHYPDLTEIRSALGNQIEIKAPPA